MSVRPHKPTSHIINSAAEELPSAVFCITPYSASKRVPIRPSTLPSSPFSQASNPATAPQTANDTHRHKHKPRYTPHEYVLSLSSDKPHSEMNRQHPSLYTVQAWGCCLSIYRHHFYLPHTDVSLHHLNASYFQDCFHTISSHRLTLLFEVQAIAHNAV